ncbi:MAG: hypothetical protein A3E83_03860 [Gammaproteobacteria bacterium RIFCSPHIGHO2_12_FULL_41_20]|nr:MAG: hypothetical protein A3E83_03860 [Gammaproteobacteria bacterium RIFCSPHIGHO2_12_FULL_41_20]
MSASRKSENIDEQEAKNIARKLHAAHATAQLQKQLLLKEMKKKQRVNDNATTSQFLTVHEQQMLQDAYDALLKKQLAEKDQLWETLKKQAGIQLVPDLESTAENKPLQPSTVLDTGQEKRTAFFVERQKREQQQIANYRRLLMGKQKLAAQEADDPLVDVKTANEATTILAHASPHTELGWIGHWLGVLKLPIAAFDIKDTVTNKKRTAWDKIKSLAALTISLAATAIGLAGITLLSPILIPYFVIKELIDSSNNLHEIEEQESKKIAVLENEMASKKVDFYALLAQDPRHLAAFQQYRQRGKLPADEDYTPEQETQETLFSDDKLRDLAEHRQRMIDALLTTEQKAIISEFSSEKKQVFLPILAKYRAGLESQPLTQEQQRFVQSLPAQDRGLLLDQQRMCAEQRRIVQLDRSLSISANLIKESKAKRANARHRFGKALFAGVAVLLSFIIPPVGLAMLFISGIYNVFGDKLIGGINSGSKALFNKDLNPYTFTEHHDSLENIEHNTALIQKEYAVLQQQDRDRRIATPATTPPAHPVHHHDSSLTIGAELAASAHADTTRVIEHMAPTDTPIADAPTADATDVRTTTPSVVNPLRKKTTTEDDEGDGREGNNDEADERSLHQ